MCGSTLKAIWWGYTFLCEIGLPCEMSRVWISSSSIALRPVPETA